VRFNESRGGRFGVSLATPPKLRRLQEALYTKAKPHRLRTVRLSSQRLLHCGQPPLQPGSFDVLERHPVHTRRSTMLLAERVGVSEDIRPIHLVVEAGADSKAGWWRAAARDSDDSGPGGANRRTADLATDLRGRHGADGHGYRPGRTALEAVQEVHRALCAGHTEMIDGAVSQYFDAIPHADLMKSLARRISDRKLLRLLKMLLKAPEQGAGGGWRFSAGKRATRGTPHGGVVSPLLSNVYMNRYLKVFRLRGLGRAIRGATRELRG
jgi:hypothetical protein